MLRMHKFRFICALFLCIPFSNDASAQESVDRQTLRVFIFAGQSNMVGSDSKVSDIKRFPPFAGLEQPQDNVKFSYSLGRENKRNSDGWTELSAVDDVVGPELSFATMLTRSTGAPIAIIKIAAGGTHLGGDWNPDEPIGFKMYPLAMEVIKSSLADLDRQKIAYRIEGFMWHQGENDMFDEQYMADYGKNLKNFLAKVRRDLATPDLKFYIGELCTKTIWGMDLRPRMHAISEGQKSVTNADPLAEYIPTSHIGVEIGGGVGLHYHYGTLGQLEHGLNYGEAYLRTIGKVGPKARSFDSWPYEQGSAIKLYVLAGHRNMEGERAFVQDIEQVPGSNSLLKDNPKIAFRYSLGGGFRKSNGWEPLGPVRFYDTFGPELSFARTLKNQIDDNIAIAKFTHSGSQIIDWTPEGSVAKSRNIYPDFIAFVKKSVEDLEDKGHKVELEGIFYHLGENDMSFGPHRKNAAKWLESIVNQSRQDLARPDLKWLVTQQSPTDDKSVNSIDVTAELEVLASSDSNLIHLKVFDLPGQQQKLVITTEGIIKLGEIGASKLLEK